ncbi:hypothetical protein K1719_019028 [Acacia pycnantha]|nr:hypothetical protein K1719_019028 [Acacia pycnantha]
MKRTLSNKIENLIEITHHPDPPIGDTELPLLSPYSYYHRTNTFTNSIISLIRTRRHDVKEVVQSTRLEQCTLPATPQEQYSTIEISSDLIDRWKSQGYTHLHFGAIRLVLTLHGRKGLPVTAKVALLDSTYKKTLPGCLKVQVQIQITGAEQDSQAIMATLHHQIVYRLQNHALDISLPNSTIDALVAISNRADDTSIIQIPRQIPKEELAQIMPMEWISNYEKLFHSIQTDVHTTTPPTTQDLGNGVTKIIFSRPSVSGPRPPGRILTLTLAYTPPGKVHLLLGLTRMPSHIMSLMLMVISYGMSQDLTVSSRRSTCCWQPPPPPEKSLKEMSLVELMIETGHHDLVQKYFPDAIPSAPLEPYAQSQTAFPQPIPCIAMLNSYDQDFPPLERKYDQHTMVDQLSEEVKNMYLHQRQQANKLDAELKAFIERGYMGSQFKQKEIELQEIQQDLKRIELDMAKKKSQAIYEPYPSFSTIPAPLFPSSPTSYPEEADYSKPFKFNYPLFTQLSPPKLPPQTKPQPRTQFVYPRQRPPHFTPFQTFDPEKLIQAATPQNPQPPSYSIVTSTTSSTPTSETITPPHTSSIGVLQNSNPFTSLQDSSDTKESQSENSSQDYSDASSEAEIADISRIAMVRPGEDEEFAESHVEHPDDIPPRQDHNYKPTSGLWFTFDDLPYEKWRSRLQEFSAWIDL